MSINRRKYRIYEYVIENNPKNSSQYDYKIFYPNYGFEEVIKSDEYFDTETEAEFAAIGRISLLETENLND